MNVTQKKVLLVDDDPDDRSLFCEAMAAVDEEVICLTEADGRVAINQLKSTVDTLPDLIFLDINMAGKNGWHYLEILKEDPRLSGIPVVMYSTSSATSDIDQAVANGALILFTKPDSFEELQESLSTIIRYLKQDSLETVTLLQSQWLHARSRKHGK